MIFGLPWPAFLAFAAQILLIAGAFWWMAAFDEISERPFWKPFKEIESKEGGE